MEFIVARKLERLINDGRCCKIEFVLEPFSPEERRLIVSKKMKKNKSFFLLAVESGHSYLVNYLIEACNVNVMEMGPCLCIAAEKRFLHIVKILVENGSNVNELDSKGFSPLYFACIAGNIEMVDYLITNGAEVNLVANMERITLLMASLRHPEICKYLLIKGADLQPMNIYGRTALMMATEMKIFNGSDFMWQGCRSDTDITDMYMKNYIFKSLKINMTITINLLKSYGADTTEPLARFYQFQACYAALVSNQLQIRIYWKMYTQMQGLPSTRPPFEIEHPNSRRSCFAPILYIFDQNHKKMFLYLEEYFGLSNPYTLQALTTSMSLVGVINGFKLFSFIVETLASCNNELFFNTLPRIHDVYRKLKSKAKQYSYIHLQNDSLELLKTYPSHVKEIADRLKRMSNNERCLVSVKIDSVFSIVASLIKILLMTTQGNMSELKESIEKIVQFDLRGSDNNTLLHFCTKTKYPVEIYQMLLLCKAEVNQRNRLHFTPVHYVLDYAYCKQTAIIKYSLAQGFRFDATIDEEFCLSCTLKKRKILPQPVKHTTLQCLAANVVGKNLFSYNEVPRHLEDFILLHITYMWSECSRTLTHRFPLDHRS